MALDINIPNDVADRQEGQSWQTTAHVTQYPRWWVRWGDKSQ